MHRRAKELLSLYSISLRTYPSVSDLFLPFYKPPMERKKIYPKICSPGGSTRRRGPASRRRSSPGCETGCRAAKSGRADRLCLPCGSSLSIEIRKDAYSLAREPTVTQSAVCFAFPNACAFSIFLESSPMNSNESVE